MLQFVVPSGCSFVVPFELPSDDPFEASFVDSLEDPFVHSFEDPWAHPSDNQEIAGLVEVQIPGHHRIGWVGILPSAGLKLAFDQNYLDFEVETFALGC